MPIFLWFESFFLLCKPREPATESDGDSDLESETSSMEDFTSNAMKAAFQINESNLRENLNWGIANPATQVFEIPGKDNPNDGLGRASPIVVHPSDFFLNNNKHFTETAKPGQKLAARIAAASIELAEKLKSTPPAKWTAEMVDPFADNILKELTAENPAAKDLTAIEPGQPFRLNLIQRMAEDSGDSDIAIVKEAKRGFDLEQGDILLPSGNWPMRKNPMRGFKENATTSLWEGNYSSMSQDSLGNLPAEQMEEQFQKGFAHRLPEGSKPKYSGVLGAVDESTDILSKVRVTRMFLKIFHQFSEVNEVLQACK